MFAAVTFFKTIHHCEAAKSMNPQKKILISIFMTMAFNKLLCPPPETAPVTPPRQKKSRKRISFDDSKQDAPARGQSTGNPRLRTSELFPEEATPGRQAGAKTYRCEQCEQSTSFVDRICWHCAASNSRISIDYQQHTKFKFLKTESLKFFSLFEAWLQKPANAAHPDRDKTKFYTIITSELMNLASDGMSLKCGEPVTFTKPVIYNKIANLAYNSDTNQVTFNYHHNSGEMEQKNMTLTDFITDILSYIEFYIDAISTIIT